MAHQSALYAQLLDLPDDDLDELLDQVLEERLGPVREDEDSFPDGLHGHDRPMREIEEAVETANQIAATLEDYVQKEYGGFTEEALRSMLLAVIEIWLRRYWSHPEEGMPRLAVQALLRTLEPEISLLATPVIAKAQSKLN
jgi:hypothetical protein